MNDELKTELELKMELELKLNKTLNNFNKRIIRLVVKQYIISNTLFDMSLLTNKLSKILLEHYEIVSSRFEHQISDKLPDDLKPTENEEKRIVELLNAYILMRSKEQSEIINYTNERDLIGSFNDLSKTNEDDNQTSNSDLAILLGVLLLKKLKSRAQTISEYETQSISEFTKFNEINVLVNNSKKKWITMGDSRVRPAHEKANGQTRSQNKPFSVGGQLLNYPGDTSLGATIDNVINCRCSSVVELDQIVDERQKKQKRSIN